MPDFRMASTAARSAKQGRASLPETSAVATVIGVGEVGYGGDSLEQFNPKVGESDRWELIETSVLIVVEAPEISRSDGASSQASLACMANPMMLF